MSLSKIVKTRKDHQCCVCSEPIKAGSLANYSESKSPVFDQNDWQIGIEYSKYYQHHKQACDARMVIEFNGHEFETVPFLWTFSDTFYAQNKANKDCFVYGASLQEMMDKIKNGDFMSHEDERIREETEQDLIRWIHSGRMRV